MDECIQKEVLTEILKRERMTIMSFILSEFDEKAYAEVIREDGYEDDLEKSTKDKAFLESLYCYPAP